MRGVFDEEELEPRGRRRDTELTLGSTTLLAIFFGMVLLCALFFGLGFAVGRYGPDNSASATQQTTVRAQPSALVATQQPKPSPTSSNTPAPQPSPAGVAVSLPVSSGNIPTPVRPSGNSNSQTAAANSVTQPVVNPALPAAAESAPLAVTTAPANLMVQIAAVQNPEDAEVLVNALRRRGYAVTARRETSDSLIHVRIGPFASRNDAVFMRQKLLNDGYNAILQP